MYILFSILYACILCNCSPLNKCINIRRSLNNDRCRQKSVKSKKYLTEESRQKDDSITTLAVNPRGAANEFNFSCISMKRAILRWLCIHHGE